MASSGFCLLNTVAVAAAYARYSYGRRSDRAPRIAIVDIDVHHGNGTEEIVRNLTPRNSFLPLPSSWAPVPVSAYKPWLDEDDAENVLFASINLYAEERFYPCSGADCAPSSSSGANIINIAMTPVGPGPWDAKARGKLSINQVTRRVVIPSSLIIVLRTLPVSPAIHCHQRSELCAIASQEMRTKVSQRLLPQLQAFRPDLLLISAGFDAHYDDFYHFLTEADYHWITSQLCEVAEREGGKVISVLEGGYSLSSPVTKPTKPLTRAAPFKAEAGELEGARAAREGKGKNKKYDPQSYEGPAAAESRACGADSAAQSDLNVSWSFREDLADFR